MFLDHEMIQKGTYLTIVRFVINQKADTEIAINLCSMEVVNLGLVFNIYESPHVHVLSLLLLIYTTVQMSCKDGINFCNKISFNSQSKTMCSKKWYLRLLPLATMENLLLFFCFWSLNNILRNLFVVQWMVTYSKHINFSCLSCLTL